MITSFFLALGSLSLVPLSVNGLVLQSSVAGANKHFTGRSINLQVQQGLAAVISNTSSIFTPTDAIWVDETERYMQNVQPQVQLSVRPGREEDVAKIVST